MKYAHLYNLNKKREERKAKSIQIIKAILVFAFLLAALGIAGNVDVKVLGIK